MAGTLRLSVSTMERLLKIRVVRIKGSIVIIVIEIVNNVVIHDSVYYMCNEIICCCR